MQSYSDTTITRPYQTLSIETQLVIYAMITVIVRANLSKAHIYIHILMFQLWLLAYLNIKTQIVGIKCALYFKQIG